MSVGTRDDVLGKFGEILEAFMERDEPVPFEAILAFAISYGRAVDGPQSARDYTKVLDDFITATIGKADAKAALETLEAVLDSVTPS